MSLVVKSGLREPVLMGNSSSKIRLQRSCFEGRTYWTVQRKDAQGFMHKRSEVLKMKLYYPLGESGSESPREIWIFFFANTKASLVKHLLQIFPALGAVASKPILKPCNPHIYQRNRSGRLRDWKSQAVWFYRIKAFHQRYTLSRTTKYWEWPPVRWMKGSGTQATLTREVTVENYST